MPEQWPSLLKPRSESWHLQNLSRSGGVSITGQEMVITSGSSRWAASLTVPIHRRDQILAFRGLIGALHGRSGTVLVGPQDMCNVTWAIDEYGFKITPRSLRFPALDGTFY